MLPTLPTPRKFTLLRAAEGGTKLNAFDNALLAAGIGSNLLKVSSILPPEAEYVENWISPRVVDTYRLRVLAMTSREIDRRCGGDWFFRQLFWVIMEYSDIATKRSGRKDQFMLRRLSATGIKLKP